MVFGKLIAAAALLIAGHSAAQTPDKDGSLVKWISLPDAMKQIESVPRPVLIDFYTDWCGWCKTMMRTTYANPQLAEYINTYFYPVKFNAEGKDTVEFLGEKYFPATDKPRATHPLAAKLLNNKLMYPTTLFLNGYDRERREFRINMIASGYLEQKKIEPMLVFVLENAGRNSSYEDFSRQFEKVFYDTLFRQRPSVIAWQSARNFFQQPESKKAMVLITADWCTSCRVMKASFEDYVVAGYIREKFVTVEFDPSAGDTLYYKGQAYPKNSTQQMPFHQLAIKLGRNSLTFPSLIILDENQDVADVIPSYVNPVFLNDIARYYGENHYKTTTWTRYMESIGKKISE